MPFRAFEAAGRGRLSLSCSLLLGAQLARHAAWQQWVSLGSEWPCLPALLLGHSFGFWLLDPVVRAFV